MTQCIDYHQIRRYGRLVWALHDKYGGDFMWSASGTYNRLFGNWWWFTPSGK